MLDKEMREPLFDYLEEFYGKIRIFEEKNAGGSRADVIGVVDSNLLGFEIKSDSDSYTRLKTQTRDYDVFCDINFLVIGKTHIKHAEEHIPPYWGILCVYEEKDQVKVEMIQIPGRNPKVSIKKQIEFLWRPELYQIQKWNDLPEYKQKSKQFVRDKIVEKIPEDILKRQMTDLLFERDYEILLEQIKMVKKENRARNKKRRKG
ncbi:MAG: sce7726 family protein [Lachnospiraceae bacterium]|nr:sce7726 family protein [Lachnospiraceae bacterium]